MSPNTPFKTSQGEAQFRAAYDAVLKLWPVPCEEIDVRSRFGTTHVIVCGPSGAPPLVLLHGYVATSIMWAPNIVDLARDHRVFAIDTMGQPSKSIPAEPIRNAADYVAWLNATLDALHLDRVCLIGQSFGGWLALTYAVAAPERVQKLVLLSAGGLLPISKPFTRRGMLMMLFPSPRMVNWFMHWAGVDNAPGKPDPQQLLNVMSLGIRNFRMPPETVRIAARPASDEELRSLRVPVLFLMGEDEVLCSAPTALARARRFIPDCEGELIPRCSHDMCSTAHQIVDARIIAFLNEPPAGQRRAAERTVA